MSTTPRLFLLALALAALAAGGAAAAASSANTAGATDLLVLDCEGAVRALPNNGLVGSVAHTPALLPAVAYFKQLVLDTAKCHCPKASDAELQQAFGLDFGNVVRQAAHPGGTLEAPEAVRDCDFTNTFYDLFRNFQPERLEMPASCSPDSWNKNGTCFVEASTSGGLELQLAVAKCPGNTPLPFVSVSCAGELCESFLRPCETNDDCGPGVGCEEFPGLEAPAFLSHLVTAVTESNVFLPGGSCADTATKAAEAALGVAGGLLTDTMGGRQNTASRFAFCGVRRVFGDHYSRDFGTVVRDLFAPCGAGSDGPAACTPDEGFSGWTGQLSSGESAVSAARMDGSAWPALPAKASPPDVAGAGGDDYLPLVELTCETRLTVLRGTPLEVTAVNPNPHRLVAAIQEQIVKPLWSCRGDKAKFGAAQFAAFQNIASPSFWLDAVSTDNATKAPDTYTVRDALGGGNLKTGEVVNGLIDAWNEVLDLLAGLGFEPFSPQYDEDYDETDTFFSHVDPNIGTRLDTAPVKASCSAEHLATHGVCAVKWTALGKALGKDVAVTLTLGACRDGLAPPSLSVGCAGKDCAEVLHAWKADKLFCEDDGDCDDRMPCEPLDGYLEPAVGRALWDAAGTTEVETSVGDQDLYVAVYQLSLTGDVHDKDILTDSMYAAQVKAGLEGKKVDGRLVRAYPNSGYSERIGEYTVVVSLAVPASTNLTTLLDPLLDALNSGPADALPGITLRNETHNGNRSVWFAYPEDDRFDWYFYAEGCRNTGSFWYDPQSFPEDPSVCPGDACANSDLFKGQLLAGAAKVLNVTVPARFNLSTMGVCRPKWVDNALKYDWAAMLAKETSVDHGVLQVASLEPFCDDCKEQAPAGGDGSKHSGGSGLSTGAVVGIAAGVVVVIAAIVMCSRKKNPSASLQNEGRNDALLSSTSGANNVDYGSVEA